LAQQIPALLSGKINHHGILVTTIAILLSTITAPFAYALLQGYVIKYGNDILLNLTSFKFNFLKKKSKNKHLDLTEDLTGKQSKLNKKEVNNES
jgi:hypothetical protein